MFVGSQESDDPLSGRMFRMFIALNDERHGIRVKLPGQIRVDPATGRIETTFDNNPQVPVDKISLRLNGGPRAPLATPLDCGTKTVTAELESWSGAVVTRSSGMTIDCPGAGPLRPSFTAGVSGNGLGGTRAFKLRAQRPDGTQIIDGLSLRMPTGAAGEAQGRAALRGRGGERWNVPGELAGWDGDRWCGTGAAPVLHAAAGCT